MTDHIPADLADKVRKLAARFRQQMEPHVSVAECVVWERAAEAVETLLPTPATLADMTEEERAACQWMQADTETWGRVVIIIHDLSGGRAALLDRWGDVAYEEHGRITPRPDLPRLEWPGTENPAPAPALPGGWRLADHEKRGRVIVTNDTPNTAGHVCFVLPADDPMGYDWLFCTPDELRYLDTDQETDTTTGPSTLAVGTVIESADDPRLATLPTGSALLDCDGEAVAKRGEVWVGDGYIPTPEEGGEFGPWTVLHIPKEADQ